MWLKASRSLLGKFTVLESPPAAKLARSLCLIAHLTKWSKKLNLLVKNGQMSNYRWICLHDFQNTKLFPKPEGNDLDIRLAFIEPVSYDTLKQSISSVGLFFASCYASRHFKKRTVVLGTRFRQWHKKLVTCIGNKQK